MKATAASLFFRLSLGIWLGCGLDLDDGVFPPDAPICDFAHDSLCPEGLDCYCQGPARGPGSVDCRCGPPRCGEYHSGTCPEGMDCHCETTTPGSCWCEAPGTPPNPVRCSAHPACIAMGLPGDNQCCPTGDGIQLACCDAPSPLPPTPDPSPTPLPSHRPITTCAMNLGCVAVGLTGEDNCCPADDGTMLACCDAPSPSPPTPHPSPTPAPSHRPITTCAMNAGCVAVGLTGEDNCCPTDDGMMLACCDAPSPSPPTPHPSPTPPPSHRPITSCAMNPGCVAVGLTGEDNCCPTDDGMTLACCDASLPSPPAPDPVVV